MSKSPDGNRKSLQSLLLTVVQDAMEKEGITCQGGKGNKGVLFVEKEIARYLGISEGLTGSSQCVYTSLESPCELCRRCKSADPCIKTWGLITERKSAAIKSISIFETSSKIKSTPEKDKEMLRDPALISVPENTTFSPYVPQITISLYDPSIDPESRHILQRAYAEANGPPRNEIRLLKLLQKFASVYGTSICHSSLREAVVLYCRQRWHETRTCLPKLIEQQTRAFHELQVRLNEPEKLDEGDLFAAFLLTHHFFCLKQHDKGMMHLRGLFTIMQFLEEGWREYDWIHVQRVLDHV